MTPPVEQTSSSGACEALQLPPAHLEPALQPPPWLTIPSLPDVSLFPNTPSPQDTLVPGAASLTGPITASFLLSLQGPFFPALSRIHPLPAGSFHSSSPPGVFSSPHLSLSGMISLSVSWCCLTLPPTPQCPLGTGHREAVSKDLFCE